MIVLKILLSQDSAGALHAEFIDGLNSVSQNNAGKNIVEVILNGFELQTEEMLQIAYATSLNENDPNTESVGFNFMEKSFENNFWLAEIDPLVLDRRGSWYLGLRVVTETDGLIQTVSNETEMLEFTVNTTIQDKNGNYPTKADVSALYKTAVNAVAKANEIATETATQVASEVAENVANEKLMPIIQVTEEQLGANFELLINENTYELTARLTAKNGAILSEKIVDLPLEEMIVDAYQNEGGNLVIVLKNGQERTIELGDLIKGLVSQKDFDDLVNSKGQPNGVATLNSEGKVPSAQLPPLDYLPITGGVVNGSVTANEFLINDADEVTKYQAHSIQEGANTYQFRGKSGTFALLSDLEPIETTANLAMQILYQSSIVYKATTKDTYNERITAEGLNVVDGSEAVLQKVVGSTVKCENLLNIESLNVLNGTDFSKDGNAITYKGNVGNEAYAYNAGEIAFPKVDTASIKANGIPVQKDKKYTVVFDYLLREKGAYDSGIGILVYNSDISTVKNQLFISGTIGQVKPQKITFTATKDDKVCILFRINNNYVTLSNIQVREGNYTNTELPPYQPYFTGLKSASFAGIESTNADGTEISTLNFPKTPTPMGTTIDFENKKIIEGSREIVFDGTEDWVISSVDTAEKHRFTIEKLVEHSGAINTINSISSVYESITSENTYLRINGLSVDGSRVYIYDNAYATKTADEFKAHLAELYASGNPVTVRYLVATPTEKDFTEEQKAAGNKYQVWANGTEKVIENDGKEYGADNTLTQDYIAIKE